MSRVEHPSPNPGDDLDGLLRAFFQGQMPHPWPALPGVRFQTAPSAQPAPRGRSLMRSRAALAASIGLLLIGSLGLTGRFKQDSSPNQVLGGSETADRKLQLEMKKELKVREFEKKNHPGLDADDGDHLPDLEEADMPRFP